MSTDDNGNDLTEQLLGAARRRWQVFPAGYRAPEMRVLADWIDRGESGCIVGLPGSGRSTLLGFLYHRRDVLAELLTIPPERVAIIPIDLNVVPDTALATLYRTILRGFNLAAHQFERPVRDVIARHYAENRAARDPFLPQSALLDLLELFEAQEMRIVWVLNRFDEFCAVATPEMMRTLRGLRDSYRRTLCFFMGMLREVAHLPNTAAVGPLYDILDIHICRVGPLSAPDAKHMIRRELALAKQPADPRLVTQMLHVTGGYPALVRVVVVWWAAAGHADVGHADVGHADVGHEDVGHTDVGHEDVGRAALDVETLVAQRQVQHRLARIWNALTQEEQLALSELHKSQQSRKETAVAETLQPVLAQLAEKGLCVRQAGQWRFFCPLFGHFVGEAEGRGRGRIWQHEETGELFQGQTPLHELTPLEREVLRFFVRQPRRRHSHSAIIDAAWPEEAHRAGITNAALHQLIRGLRKKIEPTPGDPVYVITWRGQPEGGYQFFAEGRPRGV